MTELIRKFEPDIITALENFQKDQTDDIDQTETLKRILVDWFIVHRYLPLEPAKNNSC